VNQKTVILVLELILFFIYIRERNQKSKKCYHILNFALHNLLSGMQLFKQVRGYYTSLCNATFRTRPHGTHVRLMGNLHKTDKNNKLCRLRLQVNYNERATAACWRSQCQLLQIEGVAGSANGSPKPYYQISRLETLLFLPSSFSVVVMRLSGPRSRPATSQRMEPGTLDL
jgi:hypothetical protein